MMTLRGGIQHYTLNSVFLHMLCLINHLIAVINENPTIIPRSGIPRKPKTQPHSAFTTNFPSSPSSLTSSSSSATRSPVETSPFLKDFATSIGFHSTVVDLLHEIEYLYFVVDAFTTKFMPEFREGFEDVVRSIETIVKLESEREKEWVLRRLKRWGEGYACSEDV
ncbi:hypothetical protein BDZ45DRAFT_276298 [Acephala macrosclerotiorum]|nr:hypothetical protein BDZ45DRAFT_276298 [Acephala macrosclerotiorum]